MQKFTLTFLALIAFAIFLPRVKTAKILAVYVFPGKSHFMMHGAMLKSLIERGHEVTAITAVSLSSWKLGSKYTEILIDPSYDYWGDLQSIFSAKSVYDLVNLSLPEYFKMVEWFGLRSAEVAFKQKNVQKIINAIETDGVFDVMIAAQFYQEAFLALAYKYNIPVVTVCTLGTMNYMSQMTGIITPWSFVPNGFAPYTDHMSFYERLLNSYYSLHEDLSREFFYLPASDDLVDKYFENLPHNRPSIREMSKNISLMLLNSYAPLRSPRPYADNMIDIGGVHIYPPKALPSAMQKFLDEAEYGAIYFSLGCNVESKDMPEETLQTFLKVFSKLKQRVLWKFEDDSLTKVPSNVMIGKWMPQNDILAHSNVKVFITHGGLFGTQEGIYHGVPMLGIPFYCDQHLNIKKAVLGGYALNLDLNSISTESLTQSLTDLLENPKYTKNVRTASKIFRDRPMDARETTVYWIEYVIRHKGANHLRSAGLDLNIYQFYLLDIIGFFILVLLLIVVVVYVFIRNCFKSVKNQNTSSKWKTS